MNERLSGDREMKLAPLKFRYEYKSNFAYVRVYAYSVII